MKSFLVIMSVSLAFSCKNSEVRNSFSGSDSLVIHFKDEKAGIVTRTVETAEAKAIRKVKGFIDASKTENFKCGYDGKMFFYSKGQQIQEVDFMRKDNTCRHFSFILDGKLVSTRMNNEAADFLESLEMGRMFY